MQNMDIFMHQSGFDLCKKALALEAKKPESDSAPFSEKYEARTVWSDLRSSAKEFTNQDHIDTDLAKCYLATFDYVLGVNYIETEEVSVGDEQLAESCLILADLRLDKRAVHILLNTYNQQAIVASNRENFPLALEILEVLDYRRECDEAPVIYKEYIIHNEESEERERHRNTVFEDTYTHTLYYLAQVYGKLEEKEKSAQYCHNTLHRQLNSMSYNAKEWALNCATLSQYYMGLNKFHLARHCLACACVIVQEAGNSKLQHAPPEGESAEDLETREEVPRACADIKRCFVKYALSLLSESQDRLMREVDEGERFETETGEVIEKENYFNLEATKHEEEITDKLVANYEDARSVFLAAQRWLSDAKAVYALDGHCSDHIEIVQDHSRLFKLLAFFDPDLDRQCKMHKRRVDLLLYLKNELNPQFYLLICRQLLFELGEVFSTMLDLKMAIVEETGQPPNPHQVTKINSLAKQSIEMFHEYIRTLQDKDKVLPKRFSSDDERPALIAHFYIGRLYSKIMEYEPDKKLKSLNESLQHYKFLVDYCDLNPEAYDLVRSEKDICAEMVVLLPARMDRIREQAHR